MKVRLLITALVAIVLAVAACGQDRGTPPDHPVAAPSASAPATPVETPTTPQPAAESSGELTGTVVWPDGSPVIHTQLQFLVARDYPLTEVPVTDAEGNFVLHDAGSTGQLFAEIVVGENDPAFDLGCFLATTDPQGEGYLDVATTHHVFLTVVPMNCIGQVIEPSMLGDWIRNPTAGSPTWQQAKAWSDAHV